MNPVRTGLMAVLVGGLFSGCLIIPTPGGYLEGSKRIDEETVKFIEIGTTSREEVVLRLGAPIGTTSREEVVLRLGAPTIHDNEILYLIQKRTWGFVMPWFIPAPQGVGMGVHRKPSRIVRIFLVIEFDENSIVTACRFKIFNQVPEARLGEELFRLEEEKSCGR